MTCRLAQTQEHGSVPSCQQHIFDSRAHAFPLNAIEIAGRQICAQELFFVRVNKIAKCVNVDGSSATFQFLYRYNLLTLSAGGAQQDKYKHDRAQYEKDSSNHRPSRRTSSWFQVSKSFSGSGEGTLSRNSGKRRYPIQIRMLTSYSP